MRVLTLNIWGRRGPYEARTGLIRAELARLAPDVIGLQEVWRENGVTQAETLADGLHGVFAPALRLDGADYGNALLSRHPITDAETIPLPNDPGAEPRVLLHASIATPDGPLPFFVTHLHYSPGEATLRARQAEFVAETVAERTSGGPAVLVGDFNAPPGSPEIASVLSHGLTDAWPSSGDGTPGHTYCETNAFARASGEPSVRIDYVFTSALTPARTELAFTTPSGGVWPSDHYGVLATFS
ncbi:endonuclease/exonuclease/phosphatase family protein [Actinocorallia longicatena]|uniref:Endonuclease/exonuclease/phosphatase domain-containing protein n=1 Tax=Actinocorallia longicatena TaxID=111803 RepID=A0ABP6QCE3_9ACTN